MEIAEFGRVIGHESRVAMLQALMGGKALSASELAWHAGVTNQTASSHLNELVKAELLYRRKCGRFHYYEINGASAASYVEKIASGIPIKNGNDFRRNVKPEMKKARFCYDHLAGKLGVEVSRILVQIGALTLYQDSFHLPEKDHDIYRSIGVELDEIRQSKRLLCPRCVDWTERLPHVSGALGAAIAASLMERKFIIRSRNDRSVAITRLGRSFLIDTLGMNPSFFADTPDMNGPDCHIALSGTE